MHLSQIADGLWEVHFPFSLMGVRLGRRMVVVRLADGTLQLHSPGLIGPDLRKQLENLGPVSTIIVASNFHDTFVVEALHTFPDAVWYAPPGFPAIAAPRPPLSFASAPDWSPNLAWHGLEGIPKIAEHVFLHRPSGSLLVADLVFNIDSDADSWTRFFFRLNGALNVLRPTRMFRSCIKDRDAFARSLQPIFAWDFDRLIPCHGRIVSSGAKNRLLREYKF